MRIAVTGANGQVGRAVQRVAAESGDLEVIAFASAALDVADAGAVHNTLVPLAPDCIIHAAAFTDTDACEVQQERAYTVNALGTGYVASAAAAIGCPLIAISTNYVFDGRRDEPYDEFDLPNPLSVYARSKWAGEVAAQRTGAHLLIVRTSMVYAEEGRNFIRTMLALAERGMPLRVVADQRGQPTYATDLARGLLALARQPLPGVYHLTNTGTASWYEWACATFQMAGLAPEVSPIPAAEFPRPCTPPTNGVLINRAAAHLGIALPPWQDALHRCLASMGRV
ncbi:MAG: dTDP-4-dehydrorhamnose reductase, partial [Chloroflexota bacterium]|nr:dTDP-4-dehydrorhamnose reductase [Chloroflexota bacterium]